MVLVKSDAFAFMAQARARASKNREERAHAERNTRWWSIGRHLNDINLAPDIVSCQLVNLATCPLLVCVCVCADEVEAK